MAPAWALAARPLVLVFAAIAFGLTRVFDAGVDAQAGAYAAGVLVLITSAAYAVTLSARRRQDRMMWAYALITLIFAVTTVANMVERPDGLKIAGCFIAVLIVSLVSRVSRAYELRSTGVTFDQAASAFLRAAVPAGVVNIIANERTNVTSASTWRNGRRSARPTGFPMTSPSSSSRCRWPVPRSSSPASRSGARTSSGWSRRPHVHVG
jgi:hypothetical protein